MIAYKLPQSLILNTIAHKFLWNCQFERVSFLSGRSCAEQVSTITHFIEADFQNQLEISTAFIDLSARYDTVYRVSVLYKMMKIIPCCETTRLMNAMLAGRCFEVVITNEDMVCHRVVYWPQYYSAYT